MREYRLQIEYNLLDKNIFEEKFKPFLRELNEKKESLEMEDLLNDINELNKYISHLIVSAREDLETAGYDVETIEKSFEKLFIEFYESFNKNNSAIFKYLFKDRENQLYRKRIYQINHIAGIVRRHWSEDLEKRPNLKLYIHLSLYFNSYESFAHFVFYLIKKIWEKQNQHKIAKEKDTINANHLYRYLLPGFLRIPLKNDNQEQAKNKYLDIFDYRVRNDLAHGNYYINPEKLEFEAYKTKFRDKQIHEKFQVLSNIMTWFTTLFDYKINELMRESKDDTVRSLWIDYFEIYSNSWKYNFEDLI